MDQVSTTLSKQDPGQTGSSSTQTRSFRPERATPAKGCGGLIAPYRDLFSF